MQQEESVKVPCLNPDFEPESETLGSDVQIFFIFFLACVPLSKFLAQFTLYKE